MSMCQKPEGVKRCNVSYSYFHLNLCISADWMEMGNPIYFFFFCKEALAIRRIFSLVDMITKFSIRPNVFKIGLFR